MTTMSYRLLPSDVDTAAPLIYMWEILDEAGRVSGRYIGKANGGDKRPTRHYSRNVDRLLRQIPYRNGKHYRRVHVALADAAKAGRDITLRYLCNVPAGQDIFEVEARYIREFGCDLDDGIGLNGRWKAAPPVMPAAPSAPLEQALEPALEQAPEAPADLEDLVEYVLEAYPGRFRIASTPLRYALYIGEIRVLRAKVGRGGKRVYIKCVRSKRAGHEPVEFVWDGSDRQLAETIDGELQLFSAIHGRGLPG